MYTGVARSVQVQSVLYGTEFDDTKKALVSLARSSELAIRDGLLSSVIWAMGDSSQYPRLSDAKMAELQAIAGPVDLRYDFFDGNLGTAAGHNRLAASAQTDLLLILNPDVIVAPTTLSRLLSSADDGVGIVEAKQLPIEHPKDYDLRTGATSWASTACALISRRAFLEVEGFDAASFFLYCDDVDFSWLVRQAGYRVVFNPRATVFHDKRLSGGGNWIATSAEHYYSAEAAMILAHKWSRPDLVEGTLSWFQNHGNEAQRKAATEYLRRRDEGQLPTPRDASHEVGQFLEGAYARHRYSL